MARRLKAFSVTGSARELLSKLSPGRPDGGMCAALSACRLMWETTMRRTSWTAAIGFALLASACVSATPRPTNLLVESRAAVRVAEQSGAQRDPAAAQYLALARRQIADAQELMEEGHHGSAIRVLQTAHVNAELAGELARQASARAEAATVQRQIDELQRRTP